MKGSEVDYLSWRGLREAEIDLGLNGKLDIITINRTLAGMFRVNLSITEYINHIPIPQLQELVNNTSFVVLYTHRF